MVAKNNSKQVSQTTNTGITGKTATCLYRNYKSESNKESIHKTFKNIQPTGHVKQQCVTLYALGCTLPPEKWVLHPCSVKISGITQEFLALSYTGTQRRLQFAHLAPTWDRWLQKDANFCHPSLLEQRTHFPVTEHPPLPVTGFRMKSAYLGGPCHRLSYNPCGFRCLTPFQCLTHFWLNLGPP